MQKEKREKTLFFISMIVVLFALLFLIVGGQFAYKFFGIDLGTKTQKLGKKQINWEEEYPFEEDHLSEAEKTKQYPDQQKTRKEKYCSVMEKLENLGITWSSKMWNYDEIATAGYVINATISDPGTGGSAVRLENGYWTSLQPKYTISELERRTDNVCFLEQYLEKQGIPFLYIQPPIKICKKDDRLPVGTEDYTNANIDYILNGLKQNGVNYLDLRENVHQDFEDHYKLFYKTDHHWTVQSGLWAANVVEEQLRDSFGLSIDTEYANPDLYEEKVYKEAMFGSEGHTVTHFVEKSEDFSILYPKYDTEYRVIIPDKEIDKTGSFEEVLIDNDRLKQQIQSGEGHVYETLVHGNRPLVKITNKKNENGPKIVMIKDSYSLALVPYLAMSCSELDLIDTRRANGNFNGSVRTYIEKNKPDMVLMLVNSPEDAYK